MQRKQALFLILLALHLLIILAICTKSTIANYTGFYKVTPAKPVRQMMQVATTVSSLPGIAHYAVAAGIDAGYGFFAPNVASEYVLALDCYGPDSILLYRRGIPDFAQRESVTRYVTMLGAFQDKLVAILDGEEDATSVEQRHLNAIVRSMAMNLLADDAAVSRVRATLYLYDFPSLQASRHAVPHSRLIEIESFDVDRK